MHVRCAVLLETRLFLLPGCCFLLTFHLACTHPFEISLPLILILSPQLPAEIRHISFIVAAIFIAPIIEYSLAETFEI